MSLTLSQIKTDLIAELGRSDIDTLLPTWVRNVEAKCDRKLDFPLNEQIFFQPLLVDSEYVTMPTDHLFARKVVFIVDTQRINLIYRSPTDFEQEFPIVVSGTPKFYTISGVNFRIGPRPSIAGDIEILYQLRVSKLINLTDTNDITIENSDIYFNGLAYEAYIHYKDFDSAAIFKGRLTESIAEENDRHIDRRYSGPIQINFEGSFGG